MKKVIIVFATMFLSAAVFSQTMFTLSNNRIPGNSLATQNTPGTRMFLLQNPVRGMINFQISNPVSTKYEISLYSANGQKLTSMLYEHPGGVSIKTMYIPAGVKGLCYLVLRGESERHVMEVLVE